MYEWNGVLLYAINPFRLKATIFTEILKAIEYYTMIPEYFILIWKSRQRNTG